MRIEIFAHDLRCESPVGNSAGPKLLLTRYSGSTQLKIQEKFSFLGFLDGGTCDVVGRLSRQRNARASPWFAAARRADTDSRRSPRFPTFAAAQQQRRGFIERAGCRLPISE